MKDCMWITGHKTFEISTVRVLIPPTAAPYVAPNFTNMPPGTQTGAIGPLTFAFLCGRSKLKIGTPKSIFFATSSSVFDATTKVLQAHPSITLDMDIVDDLTMFHRNAFMASLGEIATHVYLAADNIRLVPFDLFQGVPFLDIPTPDWAHVEPDLAFVDLAESKGSYSNPLKFWRETVSQKGFDAQVGSHFANVDPAVLLIGGAPVRVGASVGVHQLPGGLLTLHINRTPANLPHPPIAVVPQAAVQKALAWIFGTKAAACGFLDLAEDLFSRLLPPAERIFYRLRYGVANPRAFKEVIADGQQFVSANDPQLHIGEEQKYSELSIYMSKPYFDAIRAFTMGNLMQDTWRNYLTPNFMSTFVVDYQAFQEQNLFVPEIFDDLLFIHGPHQALEVLEAVE